MIRRPPRSTLFPYDALPIWSTTILVCCGRSSPILHPYRSRGYPSRQVSFPRFDSTATTFVYLCVLMGWFFREDLSKRFLTGGFNGVGGHSWELGPVPIPNTEVNLPGDPCGSVVRDPTRSLDRCQPHLKIPESSGNLLHRNFLSSKL